MTLIAFVGSVFSPYYAWARRRGAADPYDHCAVNVALYGARAARWAMTERGAAKLHREPSLLAIGRSDLRWTGEALEIRIAETCAPVPRRLRGMVRLFPRALASDSFALDRAGRHHWTPYAASARIEAAFVEPAFAWSGTGYFDSNQGDEPLENAFAHWTWSRTVSPDLTTVLYDVLPRHSEPHSLALRFGPAGGIEAVEAPPPARLPKTGWRIARGTRGDSGYPARVIDTLVDAPFYSRSLIHTRIHGVESPAFHESLNLDRFRAPWVQCLLPFRMPRRGF